MVPCGSALLRSTPQCIIQVTQPLPTLPPSMLPVRPCPGPCSPQSFLSSTPCSAPAPARHGRNRARARRPHPPLKDPGKETMPTPYRQCLAGSRERPHVCRLQFRIAPVLAIALSLLVIEVVGEQESSFRTKPSAHHPPAHEEFVERLHRPTPLFFEQWPLLAEISVHRFPDHPRQRDLLVLSDFFEGPVRVRRKADRCGHPCPAVSLILL